jgi:glycine/D-amino acid oxidase-like deaminating enzyme
MLSIPPKAEVVICGAGIAGIAAAYHLAVRQGVKGVVLVDERPPLTLTSDKSTEAYRNWWPGQDGAMVRLMNRSIDLLEELADESENVFRLNRRGYLFATAEAERATGFEKIAGEAEAQGAGPIRIHDGKDGAPAYAPAPAEGYRGQPDGADLIVDTGLIRLHFPYLSPKTLAVLHARRCGWFSGQQLGMYLLERARDAGVRLLQTRLVGLEFKRNRVERGRVDRGRVYSVQVLRDGVTATAIATIPTRHFVNAAGPMLKSVGSLLGAELPVYSERHCKASFPDTRGVVPREAPLLVWEDGQSLPWSAEERAALRESPDTRWLAEVLPPGVHARPEGGAASANVLMLWAYRPIAAEEIFPLPEDPYFTEVVLRGMTAMVPGLKAYLDRIPRAFVDGGYYTRTRENRFLCGPHPGPYAGQMSDAAPAENPIEGAWVLGALSGFGLMASCAAGELLAAHLTGGPLPPYAAAFDPSRYDDPAYLERLESWDDSGQL